MTPTYSISYRDPYSTDCGVLWIQADDLEGAIVEFFAQSGGGWEITGWCSGVVAGDMSLVTTLAA